MPQLKTRLDAGSPAFKAYRDHHAALAADLRETVARVAAGGGPEAQKKHVARGKLLPRERVRALLDPGAPFLELSQLAAFGLIHQANGQLRVGRALAQGQGAPLLQLRKARCLAVAGDLQVEFNHAGGPWRRAVRGWPRSARRPQRCVAPADGAPRPWA